jgi:hypothetical protein
MIPMHEAFRGASNEEPQMCIKFPAQQHTATDCIRVEKTTAYEPCQLRFSLHVFDTS